MAATLLLPIQYKQYCSWTLLGVPWTSPSFIFHRLLIISFYSLFHSSLSITDSTTMLRLPSHFFLEQEPPDLNIMSKNSTLLTLEPNMGASSVSGQAKSPFRKLQFRFKKCFTHIHDSFSSFEQEGASASPT